MAERTIPVRVVRAAAEMARRRGTDPDPVLLACGLTPQLLQDPRARCTPEQVASFVRGLWRRSDDEMFGLSPHPVPRGTFRLLCYALITSPDLRTVCARIADFAPIIPALPRFTITMGPVSTRLEADLFDIDDPDHLVTDFMLLLVHRFTGWLVGARIRLDVVELPYPRPDFALEYDLIFGAPLRFGAPRPAMEFASKLLDLPIVRSEAELEDYLKHSPADMLARRDYGTTLGEQVRRILERGLTGDWPSSDDVAARLSLSPQHVRRLLRDEGTSLGAIKEELLRDAAISALARGESVDELSARLGFSEPSAFRRAFKRWTGTTPGSYQSGDEVARTPRP